MKILTTEVFAGYTNTKLESGTPGSTPTVGSLISDVIINNHECKLKIQRNPVLIHLETLTSQLLPCFPLSSISAPSDFSHSHQLGRHSRAT
ncbi:hypothetical protein Ahy_A09g042160 isoform A [Arachis hypogaea]|uniref:Uncharacterized protein n=1 Tax=Arachis hypogaea TaxID=3818 RepID=A0A445BEZ1_ARAHY|nr:hypothetical protein Ahy_A09g042160 isoform A [Arachis hypogaea]